MKRMIYGYPEKEKFTTKQIFYYLSKTHLSFNGIDNQLKLLSLDENIKNIPTESAICKARTKILNDMFVNIFIIIILKQIYMQLMVPK